MNPQARRIWLWFAGVVAAVALCYSNHFHNSFQFDDFHTVVQNVWIRDLANLPKFFTDATTFSTLPANRTWRPLVSASLALDYRLGGGLDPLWFHISTFFWFVIQLIAMFVLFRRILRAIADAETADYSALFATAWFGLHPAMAETVNYVIQRGDLYSTLGVTASLALYAAFPQRHGNYLYLLPAALAMLAKLPTIIFPALLALYILFFEERFSRRWTAVIAGGLVTVPLAVLSARMTPPSYTPGIIRASSYIATQPFIALHYFVSFFAPLWLSADTDRAPFRNPWTAEALLGYVFVAAIIGVIVFAVRRQQWKPVAFGLAWFLLGILPTAIFPLSEVDNDHRMFLPFAGLTLAVSWSLRLLLQRLPGRALALGAMLALTAYGQGVWRRNVVWRTPETLWRDVSEKSPRNGRGLMNYGLALMEKGQTQQALAYFERAASLTPDYFVLEINTGIAHGALGHTATAEQHFRRAIALAPADAQAAFYYGRWLQTQGRLPEAAAQLAAAVRLNPTWLEPRDQLLSAYAALRLQPETRKLAESTLRLAPEDALAQQMRNFTPPPAAAPATPEDWLNASLEAHRAGRFEASIEAARKALQLRPGYAEAWNNIAAANESLGRWDEAIRAATEAVRLKPDFQLARNNLTWSLSQRLAKAHSK